MTINWIYSYELLKESICLNCGSSREEKQRPVAAQKRVEEAYRNQEGWAKSAMLNVANVGKFTSDRTIEEYVQDIWHLEKVKVKMDV